MKNDPFEGPKLKIKRAERHIADYRQAFKAFTESSSVVVFPQSDIQTRQGQIIVQSRAPVPGEMRVTAADALYNLRAALDQAVCRCVALTGQTPKNTYFPHGADKKGFEANLREKCKKVPQPVRDAIAAPEPYHGGNGSLFRVLHDLNLVDKHTDLIEILPVIRK